jgi:Fe-S-cluster containining protein
MSQPFYVDGLNFSCKRCSRCCTKESGYVYLSQNDLDALLSCLKLPKDEFIKTVGDRKLLYKLHGIDADGIVKTILER